MSTWQAHRCGAEYGGTSAPIFANTELTETIPKAGGGGGGIKLKLLSLTRVDQQGGSSTNNGPFSFLFFFPLKLVLHF